MDSPKNEVYWYTLAKPEIRSLTEDLDVDILIIGGGMAGLTAANNFIGKGLKIAIIEKDFCGAGASGKSSGFITPDSELEFADLHTKYGKENAEILWKYAVSGVEEIRNTIKKYNISCDYEEQDSFFIANNEKDMRDIIEEHELQEMSGLKNTLYDKEKMKEVLGSLKYSGGARAPDTFGIISYLYCNQLKEDLRKLGVRIYEETAAEKLESNRVIANGHTVIAKKIIVSIDYLLPSLGLYPKASYHAQTFLTITKSLTETQIKAIFPNDKLMVWDSDLIYQYYRIVQGNRLLFGASSIHDTYFEKTGLSSPYILNKIRKYQKKKFGQTFDVDYMWSGLIGVSKDFLPLVGQHHKMKNVYYISSCAGLPWAAASGKYITEKILNGRNDMDHYFNAKRKFPINNFIQTLISKPLTFVISHGLVKYFNK